MDAATLQGFNEDWRVTLKEQTKAASTSLGRNSAINTVGRVFFSVVGAVLLVRLIIYVFDHADPMASELLNARNDSQDLWNTVLSVSWPVIVLLVLGAACIGLSLYIQARNNIEFERGSEAISRLRREAADAVPRARALTHVFEETMGNARRAFLLQLWAGRSLFVVGLFLLIAFVIDGFRGEDLWTAVLGVGSIGSFVLTVALSPQKKISSHLGDVTQLQTAVTTFMRQISLLEEHAYRVVEANQGDVAATAATVNATIDRMASLSEDTMAKIQQYAEPPA